MNSKEKNFKAQKAFDEKVMAESKLDFTGEGPPFEEFAKALLKQKIFPPSYP